MKAVSGKTWVQKAVFLEPKPLFSSAFTMCSRGWYLCMELRMIWAWGEEEDISWEWRGGTMPRGPQPADRERKKRGTSRHSPKSFFPPQKLLLFSLPPQHGYYLCWGHLSPEKQPPYSQKSPSGAFFSFPPSSTPLWLQNRLGPYLLPSLQPWVVLLCFPPQKP